MPDPQLHRQTRILATLGPATEQEETIGALLDAGASLFRLNMSHAKPDWARQVVQRIRAAAAALGSDPAPEVWTRLAEVARAAGRERDAETAKRLATVGD